ncbi:MAG TPA: sigma-70 family RNA polymerase sigma factor [Pirellulaceae bacterium]
MARGRHGVVEGERTGDVSRFGQLLNAARQGDAAAQGTLMHECRDYLLLIANQDLDQELQAKLGASDFVQQTMLAAHEHFPQFRGGSWEELKGWLRQILRNDLNRARRRFLTAERRSAQREHRLNDSQLVQPQLSTDGNTPSTDAVLREESLALKNALAQLPDHYRQVIQMRDWENLSFAEIGRRMSLTDEAARKVWRRAIVKLESALRPILQVESMAQDPAPQSADDER